MVQSSQLLMHVSLSGVSVEHLISKGLSARVCMIQIGYPTRVVKTSLKKK